jgi:hypothetical protein
MSEVSANLDPLILDLLEWIGPSARPYAEVMEAWRTSCPRLTVFEDSIDRGFVTRANAEGNGRMVAITQAGGDFLAEHGRMAPGGLRAAPRGEQSQEEVRTTRRR